MRRHSFVGGEFAAPVRQRHERGGAARAWNAHSCRRRPRTTVLLTPPPTGAGAGAGAPSPSAPLPQHVAIIPDGNGRWGERQRVARQGGHLAGAENVRTIVQRCIDLGISRLTLYAMSTENMQRDRTERNRLFALMVKVMKGWHNPGARLRLVGDLDALPSALRTGMADAVHASRLFRSMELCVAVNYGGRAEITAAARRLAEDVRRGRIAPERVNEDLFSSYLSVVSEPDLIIRTGGQQRLSNFLLWQAAYAELYFTDVLWPDFGVMELDRALSSFQLRQRHFGRQPQHHVDA